MMFVKFNVRAVAIVVSVPCWIFRVFVPPKVIFPPKVTVLAAASLSILTSKAPVPAVKGKLPVTVWSFAPAKTNRELV